MDDRMNPVPPTDSSYQPRISGKTSPVAIPELLALISLGVILMSLYLRRKSGQSPRFVRRRAPLVADERLVAASSQNSPALPMSAKSPLYAARQRRSRRWPSAPLWVPLVAAEFDRRKAMRAQPCLASPSSAPAWPESSPPFPPTRSAA
jgi:hypothetical protein